MNIRKKIKTALAVASMASMITCIGQPVFAAPEYQFYAYYETDTAFVVPASGSYRIICVGASGDGGEGAKGGNGNHAMEKDGYTGGAGAGGSSGAIAVSDLNLTAGTTINMTFASGTAKFDNYLRAEAGANGENGSGSAGGKRNPVNAKAYGGNVTNLEGYAGGQGGQRNETLGNLDPKPGENGGGKLSIKGTMGMLGGGGGRYPDCDPIQKYLQPSSSFVADGFCGGAGKSDGYEIGGDGNGYLTWRDQNIVLSGGGGGGEGGVGGYWSYGRPWPGGKGGKGQPAVIIIERPVDSTSPTISSVSVPNQWGTTAAITVVASDDLSGITAYASTTANTPPSGGWQASSQFTMTQNGTYYAWAKDGSNNISNGKEFTVSTIDTVGPTVNTVSVPDTWGSSSLITIPATDSQSGVSQYACTTTNLAPTSGWQSSNQFTITDNGPYYAWAKDALGNVSASQSFYVSKIDKIKPLVNTVTVPDGWGGTSKIGILGTDGQSGIAAYAYTTTNAAPSGWQQSNEFTISANGTYYAWTKDAAGNISDSKAFTVSKIDNIPPTVDSVAIPDTWGADSTITVTASDGQSGISGYAYTSANVAPTSGWQSTNQFTISANGQYYAWAKDSLGNISSGKLFAISKIDDIPPTVDSVAIPEIWGLDSTITITASDGQSGVSGYAYTSANVAPTSGWQSSNQFTITANGQYYAWAKDAIGNISSGKLFTVSKIDNIKPKISAVDVQDVWLPELSAQITAADDETRVTHYAVTEENTPPASSGWVEDNVFRFQKNGTFYAWAKDLAGNVSESKAFVVAKVDRVAPTITEVKVPDVWASVSNVTVTASDNLSGVEYFTYTSTDRIPVDGWQSSDSFQITGNGTYYAWAKDRAGNISSGTSFTIEKVDTIPPMIDSMEFSENKLNITIMASDQGGSGLKGIYINNILFDGSPIEYAIPNKVAELHIQAIDNAGNRSVMETKPVEDVVAPVIDSITFPNYKTALIKASDRGSSGLKGVYVNEELQEGGDIVYEIPDGIRYLNLRAEDNAGNASELKKKRVPGWSQITDMVTIVSVNFDAEIAHATITAASSEPESEITGIYVDGQIYGGNGITCPVKEGQKYLRIQAINNFGDKSELVLWRVPGWWQVVDTITIEPVEFSKDNKRATITAKTSAPGTSITGIYIGESLYSGNPVNYTIPDGTQYLYLQAENDQGDRSVIYTVRVPGWGDVSGNVRIKDVEFEDGYIAAMITAESELKDIAGISINDEFQSGNPVVYDIPDGTKHLKMQAEDTDGEKSPVVIKRVPGWSQIVDTIKITTVNFSEGNTKVSVAAIDTTGKLITGIYVNEAFVPGNPITYQIPEGVKILHLQAVNSDGDKSAIVNRAVPDREESSSSSSSSSTDEDKDGDSKKSLRVSIQQPDWTNENRVKVKITAVDKDNDIDEILATSGDKDDWEDVTTSKYIYISENTTVYARATNGKGVTKEASLDIDCFDRDAPAIAASQENGILYIQVTDDKSGVDGVTIGGRAYSASETKGIIQYALPTEEPIESILIEAKDKAGNIGTATFRISDDFKKNAGKQPPNTGRYQKRGVKK